MEALVNRHEGTAIVKDVRKEIDSMLSQLYGKPGVESGGGGKSSRSRVRGADRKGAKQEVRTVRRPFLSAVVFLWCADPCGGKWGVLDEVLG